MQAIGDMANAYRTTGDAQVTHARLDSRYRYLRLWVGSRSTLLILGYVDPAPLGPIETWYSPGGAETIRLQNGRLVGGTNLPVEWLNVQLSAQPAWSGVGGPVQLTRRRDVMPGYEFGVVDTLTVTAIPKPGGTRYVKGTNSGVHWFRETSTGTGALPPARYAVTTVNGVETVIYGEQCLSRTFCIAWQRWPANRS